MTGRRPRASRRASGWTSTSCASSPSRSPSAGTCTGSTRSRCTDGRVVGDREHRRLRRLARAGATASSCRYLIGGRPHRACRCRPPGPGADGIRRTWRAEGAAVGPAGPCAAGEGPRHRRRRPRPRRARQRHQRAVPAVRGRRPPRLPSPGAARWTGPDTLDLLPYDNGAVGWRAVRTVAVAHAARVRAGVVVPAAGHDPARDGHRARPARLRWSRPWPGWAACLPSRRLAVLEADGGRAFDGNVRALGDGLAAARPPWTRGVDPPGRARRACPPVPSAVERQSLRAAWLLARAAPRRGRRVRRAARRSRGRVRSW